MGSLINKKKNFEEGEFICRWMYNRIWGRNQNFICVFTGPTGSGKSYGCLRVAELHYKMNKKGKRFPTERNTCFSIAEVIKLLASGKLKKGDLIILEEGGVNFGSADWQGKVSKMFNYILQSFRSLNVGLLINLPVFSMLNKSARLLVHAQFTTMGIDYQEKTCKFKILFHQLNQHSGKSYWKHGRAFVSGKVRVLKRFHFALPTADLIRDYEARKLAFISDITQEFKREVEQIEKEKLLRMNLPKLTANQQEVYQMHLDGMTVLEIAEVKEVDTSAIYQTFKWIRNRGYKINRQKYPRKTEEMGVKAPLSTTPN